MCQHLSRESFTFPDFDRNDYLCLGSVLTFWILSYNIYLNMQFFGMIVQVVWLFMFMTVSTVLSFNLMVVLNYFGCLSLHLVTRCVLSAVKF